jgi:hypothetical protein
MAKKVKIGFIIAGLTNIIGVLLFSKAFTNEVLRQAYPSVFNDFGLLMIMVWGVAYIVASTIEKNIKWIALAFALEKLVYVITWIMWISKNDVSSIYPQDFLAGVFYSIYGPVDFLFMVFFVWTFSNQFKRSLKFS